MGKLPTDRLTPYVRPFTYTGVDYFGPVNITIGRRHEKRWVALFTCLTIRAVHLEVAFDLSTDACILAIRNFINRRGTPLKIRSDNGMNFVGVDQEAKRFEEVFDVARIQENCRQRALTGSSIAHIIQQKAAYGNEWSNVSKRFYELLSKKLPQRNTPCKVFSSRRKTLSILVH